LVTSLQSHVGKLEDTVMEESDAEGEVVGSSDSSSNLDPVENMVAIPVPAPGIVVHTLVPVDIPLEFVPPILCDPNPLDEVEGSVIAHAQASPSLTYVESWEEDPMHLEGVPEL
jgi:hypothetical protein